MSQLKPCPSCHITRTPVVIEIGRFIGWEVGLLCSHASCDFTVRAFGLTRRGANRRVIKKWNRRVNDG